jgi:isocitrate dehydrogenase (NAD+)
MLKVTLIQGGGAGDDQAPAVKAILQAAGVSIEWDEHLGGWASMHQGGKAIPDDLLASVRRTGVALKTKLLPPPGKPGELKKERGNYNVDLRRELGLFATVRPLKNLPGLPARFSGVDMVVIREITEDLYAAIEHEIVPGVVQSIKVVTKAASERFLRFAFDYTRQAGRKSIACVHKANILKKADGLFLEAFRAVGADFPEFDPKAKLPTRRELIVDNCCQQLVMRPQQFDVLVMGNLYGDIVSDLAAGVVGGISATHGINVGENVRVYEAVHGGGRDAIPEGRANPLPLLLPALDLLGSHGHAAAAARIHEAAGKVLTARQALTPDLGGTATTAEMADAIIKDLARSE